MKKILLITLASSLMIIASILTIQYKTNLTKKISHHQTILPQEVVFAEKTDQIDNVLEKHRESLRLAETEWHPVSPFSQ